MAKVRDKTVFCPKYTDIKLLPCPTPPHKQFLLDEISKIEREQNISFGIELCKQPDWQWLIGVLSTMKPQHPIFKKDYLPPLPP